MASTKSDPAPPKRAYRLGRRAEQMEQTRRRVFDAAFRRFCTLPYAEVTLEMLARDAGVSVQTLLRHFGSKEQLISAGTRVWSAEEKDRRAVPVGDNAAAARVLCRRYAALAEVTPRI